MADYLVMDEEQKEAANKAAEEIFEVCKEHNPMAAFEALCTVTALLATMLHLPLSSAQSRIRDRYNVMAPLPEEEEVSEEKPEEFEV